MQRQRFARRQFYQDWIVRTYDSAGHDDAHDARLANETALRIAAKASLHQTRLQPIHLDAGVAQPGHLDDGCRAEMQSRTPWKFSQLDPACGHILAHLSGRNADSLLCQFLEQLGGQQVHLAEVGRSGILADAIAMAHGDASMRIAFNAKARQERNEREHRLREAVRRTAADRHDLRHRSSINATHRRNVSLQAGMHSANVVSPAPFDLAASARGEMVHEGFHIGDAAGSAEQLAAIRAALSSSPHDAQQQDLRRLLWSSIDNDTSRDLDQIEYAERAADGAGIRVLVAIADVASAVVQGSPLDVAAAAQTQTVYTAVHNFPMLPNELSTDLTSLNEGEDRSAMVVEFTVDAQGLLTSTSIYPARVRNQYQLAYSTTGPFLDGTPRPDGRFEPRLQAGASLAAQLRLQDEAAQRLHAQRVRLGALDFRRTEADPVVIDGRVQTIEAVLQNRAADLIADFMIAANETMALTLRKSGRSCLRRVVRSPERWSRIVTLVAGKNVQLPAEPNSAALNDFLQAQRAADPVHYPDLSLAIIKLMGPGEYVLAKGGEEDQPGHFGLAALDYTHSTAPNRRFADLVTQRVVKAMIANQPAPYTDDELAAIAQHLNERDSAARKVERTMQKRIAAVALSNEIGRQFQGVITGANAKGTFVRVFNPPVEGMVVHGAAGLDVGDTTTVTLARTDPAHAFIDFTRP